MYDLQTTIDQLNLDRNLMTFAFFLLHDPFQLMSFYRILFKL